VMASISSLQSALNFALSHPFKGVITYRYVVICPASDHERWPLTSFPQHLLIDQSP
jgi:hypothetical protein